MLALFLVVGLIVGLVVRDCLRRPCVSGAVWLPTALLLILGSRPLSLWAEGGDWIVAQQSNSKSTIDQVFFAAVFGGSFIVTGLRSVKWRQLVIANMALMTLYCYFAVSALWSADPVGSITRITKDCALLFVIGVILSEKDPLQAMKAVYVRSAFVLFPLSLVLIKYFPQYSRVYSRDGVIGPAGVTTQKNSLGEIVLLCTMFVIWDYIDKPRVMRPSRRLLGRWDLVLVLIIGLWLLELSQSKTAFICALIGGVMVLRGRWLTSTTVNLVILYGALSLPFVVCFSHQFSELFAPIVEALGRNMTFTGRTDIWQHITWKTVNPWIGAGYWNFWGGHGGSAIANAMQTRIPNAHNGYLDMFLDGGILGLTLLFIVLVTCGRRLARGITRGSLAVNCYQRVRFAVFIIAIIYNLSETTFVRLGPSWFTVLLMIVEYHALKRRSKRGETSGRQMSADVNSSQTTVAGF